MCVCVTFISARHKEFTHWIEWISVHFGGPSGASLFTDEWAYETIGRALDQQHNIHNNNINDGHYIKNLIELTERERKYQRKIANKEEQCACATINETNLSTRTLTEMGKSHNRG